MLEPILCSAEEATAPEEVGPPKPLVQARAGRRDGARATRIATPPGICKACHREAVRPGKHPGVAHTYSDQASVGVCTKTTRESKKRLATLEPRGRIVSNALKSEEQPQAREDGLLAAGFPPEKPGDPQASSSNAS